jgi:hypothetical protein
MGKSNRPDDGDRWEEEPKDTRRRLALQQRDGDEDDVDTDGQDDGDLAEGAGIGRNSERRSALRRQAVAHIREDVVDLLTDHLEDDDHDDGDEDEDERVLDHPLTTLGIVPATQGP